MSEKELDIFRHLQLCKKIYKPFFQGELLFDCFINEWEDVFRRVNRTVRPPVATYFRFRESGKVEQITETYEQIIDFYDQQYVRLEWDIVFAYQWLLQTKYPKKQLRVKDWLPYIQRDQVVFDNEEKKVSYLPIIIIDSYLGYIVLNGNHRLMNAYYSGRDIVEGYQVKGLDSIEWMISDYMKCLYQFFHDMKRVDEWLRLIKNTPNVLNFESLYHLLEVHNAKKAYLQ